MWVDGPAAMHRQTLLLLILSGILYKYACAKASDCQAVVEAVGSGRKARIRGIALVRVFLVADRVFAKAGVKVATQHIFDDEQWAFTTGRMEKLRRVLLRLPSASRRKMTGPFGLNSGDLWIRSFTCAGVRSQLAKSTKSDKPAVGAKATTNKSTKRCTKAAKSAKSAKSAKKFAKVDTAVAMKRCKELEGFAASLDKLGLFTNKMLLWHDVYQEALKIHLYGVYGAVRLARNASLVRQSMGLPVLIEEEKAWRAILRMHKNVSSAAKLLGLGESDVSDAKDAAEQIKTIVSKFNKGGAAFRTATITLGCMAILACEYECVLRKVCGFGVKSAAAAADAVDDSEELRRNAATWLLQCLPRTEVAVRQLRKRVLAAMFRSPDAYSGWDRCSAVSTLAWLRSKDMLKPESDVSVEELPSWFVDLLRPEPARYSSHYVSSESDEPAESSEAEVAVECVVSSNEWSDESEAQTVERESEV